MEKVMRSALILGCLSLWLPIHALGASLGLTTQAPTLTASTANIDYLEFGTEGDLSTFGTEIDAIDGISTNGVTELGFGFGFSLSDPTTGIAGGFDISDEDGLFLAGDILAVGFSEGIIELQFDTLSGAGAGNFGSSVLAVLTFNDPLGSNPFAALVDGESYMASITVSDVVGVNAGIDPPNVSEPALWSLFLPSLLGMTWFGRRRRKASQSLLTLAV